MSCSKAGYKTAAYLFTKSQNYLANGRRPYKNYAQLRATNDRDLTDTVALRSSIGQLNQALEMQRQMQSELLVMEKNAALGSLIAGVSHELNTPIGNCLVAASSIQQQLDELCAPSIQGLSRHEMAGFIQSMRAGADILVRNLGRVATLMSDFKKITVDRSGLSPCDFDLYDAIETIIGTKSVRKHNHRIENHAPLSLTLNGYLSVFNDVISELVDNALRHGFRDCQGGTIIVAASRGIDFVELTVIDDGCGISPEHLGKR